MRFLVEILDPQVLLVLLVIGTLLELELPEEAAVDDKDINIKRIINIDININYDNYILNYDINVKIIRRIYDDILMNYHDIMNYDDIMNYNDIINHDNIIIWR